MSKKIHKSISEVFKEIQKGLDIELREGTTKKVAMLFACNSSGKTRLSKNFCEWKEEEVLYYNAYAEDLFSWDNKNYILNFQADSWIFQTIGNVALENKVIENFKNFIGLNIETEIDIEGGKVTFKKVDGDETVNIKISRGEERVFIWSIYYTILERTVNELNKKPKERANDAFDNFKYVVIDDPVSSIDDTRIITIALELAELISKSENDLKFLIMTHHPLFFNVLYNFGKNERKWDKKNYLLYKSGPDFHLKGQGDDSPFAYHHLIIFEIFEAIEEEKLRKYHFNLFRALLEKSANFLGFTGWKKLLSELENKSTFIKKLDHFSHDRLSDLDQKELTEEEKEDFIKVFDAFITEFNWEKSNFTNSK